MTEHQSWTCFGYIGDAEVLKNAVKAVNHVRFASVEGLDYLTDWHVTNNGNGVRSQTQKAQLSKLGLYDLWL